MWLQSPGLGLWKLGFIPDSVSSLFVTLDKAFHCCAIVLPLRSGVITANIFAKGLRSTDGKTLCRSYLVFIFLKTERNPTILTLLI